MALISFWQESDNMDAHANPSRDRLRVQWVNSLSDTEVANLVRKHAACLGEKEANATKGAVRLSFKPH